jgi:hypothetical protein
MSGQKPDPNRDELERDPSMNNKPLGISASDCADLDALRADLTAVRARLDSLERILQLRDAALATSPSAPASILPAPPPPHSLPDHFDIAADQLLPTQDGFYQLEWGPEGALRWTGPGPDVLFEAWIDRSAPLVATLRLFHFGTPANAKDLTIDIDGVVHRMTRQGSEKLLRSDPIAPRPGDSLTRIKLRVPHLHSPADRGQTDKRILGVAFQRLLLERA